MYRLASDFAEEHGDDACDYAWRAVITFEAEGEQRPGLFLVPDAGDAGRYRQPPHRSRRHNHHSLAGFQRHVQTGEMR